MGEDGTLAEVQEAVERAAEAIVGLEEWQWAGWVVYLLEALESRTEVMRGDALLQQMRSNIQGRLEMGRW